MPKSKFIPFGFAALALAVSLLASAMSCTRVQAPLEPVALTPLPSTPATATPTLTRTPAPTPAYTPTPLPTPAGHFQNFEENNGTSGPYYEDIGSASSVFTNQACTGSRALQTSIGAVAAGSVLIHAAAPPLDLTTYTNIWIMVYAPSTGQTLELTLTDGLGYSDTRPSSNTTVGNTWTMISWPLSGFDVNINNIVSGTIRISLSGIYRLDDMRFGNF